MFITAKHGVQSGVIKVEENHIIEFYQIQISRMNLTTTIVVPFCLSTLIH